MTEEQEYELWLASQVEDVSDEELDATLVALYGCSWPVSARRRLISQSRIEWS